MSSVFRLAKAKAASASRLKRAAADGAAATISSPLAKRTAAGLSCALCGCRVGGRGGAAPAVAWAAHVNSGGHRAQTEAARRQLAGERERPPPPLPPPPAKRPRGILKNAPPRPRSPSPPPDENGAKEPEEQTAEESTSNNAETEETLPEGFFDDPIMDAKARNIQYRDPIEEEWEKFQKEMKEETDLSAAIIAGEQEEATAERQIEEIEEQIRNLSKVLDLTKKKEEAAKQKASEEHRQTDGREGSSDEDEDFEEYLDWRAKKSYR